MRRAARRDSTEKAIVEALRKAGADVILLDEFDLLVWFRGKLFMLDAKSPHGKPTAAQETLKARGWPLCYVQTEIEALQAIGAAR